MHCPNCGKQNADQTKYCRDCGNDIEIVSQAIKGRLPILIASKVDQILDSRSERFRRDSLISGVMGLTVLSGGLVSWFNGFSGVFSEPASFIIVTLFSALLSLLEFAAYRRSLSPDFDWTDQEGGFTSLSFISLGLGSPNSSEEARSERPVSEVSRSSAVESPARQLSTAPSPFGEMRQIYCPGCGRANAHDAKGCCVCGANLELIAIALQPRQKSWLTAMLDSYIRWRDRNLVNANQSSLLAIIMTCLWVVLFIQMISRGENGSWYYLLIAAILAVTGAWDRITFRRNFPDIEPRTPKPLSASSKAAITGAQRIEGFDSVKFVAEPAEGELVEPASITESTTRSLEADSSLRTDPLRKHAVASDED